MSAITLVSNLLQIDRSKPFEPVAFIGEGWSIIEQDERSLALTEVDLNKITFETTFRSGEVSVRGEEKKKRLIASAKVRIDAKVVQTLLEKEELIPGSWKKNGHLCFYGTEFLRPNWNERYVLCLSWVINEWRWYCTLLDCPCDVCAPAVCL